MDSNRKRNACYRRYGIWGMAVVLCLAALLGCSRIDAQQEPVETLAPTAILPTPEPTHTPEPTQTPEPADRTEEEFTALWEEFQRQYLAYGALSDRGLLIGQNSFESGQYPSFAAAEENWNRVCQELSKEMEQLDREKLETSSSLHFEYLENYFAVRNAMGKTGRQAEYDSVPMQSALLLWAFPVEKEEDIERLFSTVSDLKRFCEEMGREKIPCSAEEILRIKTEAPGLILSAIEEKLIRMELGEERIQEERSRFTAAIEQGFGAMDCLAAAEPSVSMEENEISLTARLTWKAGVMEEPEEYCSLLEKSLQELVLIYHSLEEDPVIDPAAEQAWAEETTQQEESILPQETEEEIPDSTTPVLPTAKEKEMELLPQLFDSLSAGTVYIVTGNVFSPSMGSLQKTEAYEVLFSWITGEHAEVSFSIQPSYYDGLAAYLTEWMLISGSGESMIEDYRSYLDELALDTVLPAITDLLVLQNEMDEKALEDYLEHLGFAGVGLSNYLYQHANKHPLQSMGAAMGYVHLSMLMRELSALMEDRFREEAPVQYLAGIGPLYWNQVSESAYEWAEKTMTEG